jgi:predicted RNA-binding protein Jag
MGARYIDIEGDTVEEALEKFLKEHSKELSEIRYKVLRLPVGRQKAKVRIFLDTEDFDILDEIAREFLHRLGVKGSVDIDVDEEGNYYVNFDIQDLDSTLIGNRGRILRELNYILKAIVNKRKRTIRVNFDIARYMRRRIGRAINKAKALIQIMQQQGKNEIVYDAPIMPEEAEQVRRYLKNLGYTLERLKIKEKGIRSNTGEPVYIIKPLSK